MKRSRAHKAHKKSRANKHARWTTAKALWEDTNREGLDSLEDVWYTTSAQVMRTGAWPQRSLPEDVWQQILHTYVSEGGLPFMPWRANKVLQVCKTWRRLTTEMHFVWKIKV